MLDIQDTRNGFNRSNSAYYETDEEVAYYAGKLEANVTASLILQQWENTMASYCDKNGALCDSLQHFIDENDKFMMTNTQQNLNDPYWYQVSYTLKRHPLEHCVATCYA